MDGVKETVKKRATKTWRTIVALRPRRMRELERAGISVLGAGTVFTLALGVGQLTAGVLRLNAAIPAISTAFGALCVAGYDGYSS
tara:strand:- start:172 stop:426 length:255 start_codon:yes stop_codon:yes gene_type:complete